MKDLKTTYHFSRRPTPLDRKKQLCKELMHLLKEHRRYRNGDCSLQTMAELLGVSPRKITQAVQTVFEENFCNLVNSLRLHDACTMLRNPKYNAYTLEEVALLTGFQSRQAFYIAFNRTHDCTPAEYRKGQT